MASESPWKQSRVTTESACDCNDLLLGNFKEDTIQCATAAKEPCKITLEALSNFLVLQNIFRNLSNNDLECCCQVNPIWMSVANPMFIRYYNVEEEHYESYLNYNHENAAKKSHCVVIKTITSPFVNTIKVLKYNFPEACKFLQQASQTQKIALKLSIEISNHSRNDRRKKFLTQFGHLVEKFSLHEEDSYMPMGTMCEQLVRYFPNLQCLYLTGVQLDSTNSKFNPNLPENQLKNLEKIYYTNSEKSNKNLVVILSIAPNLKEFYNFPVLQFRSLVITQKAKAVKSLVYPSSYISSEDEFDYDEEYIYGALDECDTSDEEYENYNDRETFETALEKFAQLEPKLAEFDFRVCDCCPDGYFCDYPRLSIVKRILQSSHDSLKTLSIFPSISFDFSGISPFTSLTKLKFHKGEKTCRMKLFKSNANLLLSLFPKVSVLEMSYFEVQDIPKTFPKKVFSPWGSQIQELQMKRIYDMTADVVRLLSQSFTFVKNFQFSISAVPEDLKPILSVIAEKWPAMESLTIEIQGRFMGDKAKPCTFDSLFTGIPEDVLEQLKDPLSRSMFTSEEIKAFRCGSPLLKMPSLKTLEMNFDSEEFIKRLSTITLISKEFVFDFLPALMLVFRSHRYFLSEFSHQLQAALSQIFKYEIRQQSKHE